MEELIEFARELALYSGKLIRGYFEEALAGGGPAVMRKADRSPVTKADREAEAMMRGMIRERFPDHQVLGEEGGSDGPAQADYRWILDPIDGTKSFIHGVPLFGTLIALVERGTPVIGVINLPATGEMMIGARDRPTTVNGRPVRVRETARLSEATVLFTDLPNMTGLGHGPALEALGREVELMRGWGDCYGHFLVAAGRADAMIDPELNLWDVAALKPCVEGAGGRLTDLAGVDTGLGESALSTNGLLHDRLLERLKRPLNPPEI